MVQQIIVYSLIIYLITRKAIVFIFVQDLISIKSIYHLNIRLIKVCIS